MIPSQLLSTTLGARGCSATLALALLMTPSSALAAKVVFAPLIAKNVDGQTATNINLLISGELDFSPEVSSLIELDERPGSLNDGCLGSTSCLGGITKSNGGEQLVTGVITGAGENFEFDLILYDGTSNTIVRREQFTISSQPAEVADGMTPVIRKVLTGMSPQEEEEASVDADDFAFDEEEDEINFDMEAIAREEEEAARKRAEEARRAEEERRRVEEEARKRAEEEARRREEEERLRREEEERRRAEEERRRREEEERRRAEEEARKRAETEARRRADEERLQEEEARKAETSFDEMEEFDPSLISFGAAADEIQAEDIDAAIQFGPAPSSGGSDDELDLDFDDDLSGSGRDLPPAEDDLSDLELERMELEGGGIVDIDEEDNGRGRDRDRGSRDRTNDQDRGSKGQVDKDKGEGKYTFDIHLRGGLSKYYAFNFTVGSAEVSIPFGQTGVYGMAGFSAFATQRAIPPKFRTDPNKEFEWNLIYPLNAGVAYKILKDGIVRPYVGADMITVQYFRDEVGSDWAFGGRARLGADFMFSDVVGANADLAVGYWSGRTFSLIQAGVENSGVLPVGTIGLTLSF